MNQVLTAEELQQLQEIRKQVLELASALGELGYQQVLLDLDKEKLTESIKELKQKERILFDDFGKKYGDGVVNLDTGEVQSKQ